MNEMNHCDDAPPVCLIVLLMETLGAIAVYIAALELFGLHAGCGEGVAAGAGAVR